jgi:hypothetical protein
VLEELLAAKQLKIRVLDPALAKGLVGVIVHVLEDGEPRHRPRRQRRAGWNNGVNRAEPLLQKAPVDGRGELGQRMAHVDNLIESRSKQILLPAVPWLLWPHRETPHRHPTGRENHNADAGSICKKTSPNTDETCERGYFRNDGIA